MTTTMPAGPSAPAGDRGPRVPPRVGVLGPFVQAGVFRHPEVHLADAVARLVPGTPPEVLLAVALAARGPRLGHVCVRLRDVAHTVDGDRAGRTDEPAELPWPEIEEWVAALDSCPEVVSGEADAWRLPLRPLVRDGENLYLQRWWSYEDQVARALRARTAASVDELIPGSEAVVPEVLDRRFGAGSGQADDAQRDAVRAALGSALTVIAGGPGTGKTTTVAGLLLTVRDLAAAAGAPPPRVALAAPTGKAAARMSEALAGAFAAEQTSGTSPDGEVVVELPSAVPAVSLHRLLGARPGAGFLRDDSDPLDFDLVVVDEASMIDLRLFAHLLEALPAGARLLLVGDPHQLASVEAGTVLADVVTAATDPSTELGAHLHVLERRHRYDETSAIASLAEAIRNGREEDVMSILGACSDAAPGSVPPSEESVGWVRADDATGIADVVSVLAETGARAVELARLGEGAAALEALVSAKLLTATRRGPAGLSAWNGRMEEEVAGILPPGWVSPPHGGGPYVGMPILVRANDAVLGVANGDVGVVVAADPGPAGSGATRLVAVRLAGEVRLVPLTRLPEWEPWWAMTIHKSQGSEFPDVVVCLPEPSSPILTRELLYTAVTRARRSVRIVAGEESIRAAVRTSVGRASGLAGRLLGSGGSS